MARTCSVMAYDNHTADTALLAASNRIEVAEHNVTAGHELYSAYSSAAVAARWPRPALVHSTSSSRYAANSALSAASLR